MLLLPYYYFKPKLKCRGFPLENPFTGFKHYCEQKLFFSPWPLERISAVYHWKPDEATLAPSSSSPDPISWALTVVHSHVPVQEQHRTFSPYSVHIVLICTLIHSSRRKLCPTCDLEVQINYLLPFLSKAETSIQIGAPQRQLRSEFTCLEVWAVSCNREWWQSIGFSVRTWSLSRIKLCLWKWNQIGDWCNFIEY